MIAETTEGRPFDYLFDRFEEILRSADSTGGTLFMTIRTEDWFLIDAMVRDGYLRQTDDGDYDIATEGFVWLCGNPKPAPTTETQATPQSYFEIRGRRFGEDREFIVGRCGTRAEAERDLETIAAVSASDPSLHRTKRWIVEIPA